MASIRLRLVFKTGGLLSTTQESQGLNRSWLLLRPDHQPQTIASLSAYIIQKFQLHQSCPDGILIYMDDFVLPPFESINILKDKDIVSVEKKGGGLCIEGDDAGDELEEMQIVEKRPVHAGVLLLANEEFDKETGGYQSEESEEDDEDNKAEDSEHLETTNLKKRKASEKFQGPLCKKQRSEHPRCIENEDHPEQPKKSFNEHLSKKKGIDEKEKLSKHGKATTTEINAKRAENTNGHVDAAPSLKRNEQQETDQDIDGSTQVSESNQKRLSRSARRKYAKRKLLKMAKAQKDNLDSQSKEVEKLNQACQKAEKREEPGTSNLKGLRLSRSARRKNAKRKLLEMAKAQKDNLDSQSKEVEKLKQACQKAEKREEPGTSNLKGLLHWNHSDEGVTPKTYSKNKEDSQTSIVQERPIQNGGGKDELVTVMIKPGHIRFESQDEDADEPAQKDRVDADQPVQNDRRDADQPQNDRVDSYQIGQQNQLSVESFKWNGISSKKKGQKWGIEKSSISHKNRHSESRGYDLNKKDTCPVESVDFDKLPPLPSVPKEGDVVAYRLLELSSSWTPELSSYRVGEVSQYNSESGQIILMPVPEFPFVSDMSNEDECEPLPDNPLYKEDGSLEIDFTSLVDVRAIRCSELDHETVGSVPAKENESPLCNENSATLMLPNSNNNHLTTSVLETGESSRSKTIDTPSTGNGVNPWEEISEALNAKKTELSKANGGDKSSSGKSSWSHRTLKGSALGPVMALLRSHNKITNEN